MGFDPNEVYIARFEQNGEEVDRRIGANIIPVLTEEASEATSEKSFRMSTNSEKSWWFLRGPNEPTKNSKGELVFRSDANSVKGAGRWYFRPLTKENFSEVKDTMYGGDGIDAMCPDTSTLKLFFWEEFVEDE